MTLMGAIQLEIIFESLSFESVFNVMQVNRSWRNVTNRLCGEIIRELQKVLIPIMPLLPDNDSSMFLCKIIGLEPTNNLLKIMREIKYEELELLKCVMCLKICNKMMTGSFISSSAVMGVKYQKFFGDIIKKVPSSIVTRLDDEIFTEKWSEEIFGLIRTFHEDGLPTVVVCFDGLTAYAIGHAKEKKDISEWKYERITHVLLLQMVKYEHKFKNSHIGRTELLNKVIISILTHTDFRDDLKQILMSVKRDGSAVLKFLRMFVVFTEIMF
jgi:hypothetical protein